MLENDSELTPSEELFLIMQEKYIQIVGAARAWLSKPTGCSEPSYSSNDVLTLLNALEVEFEPFSGDPLKYSVSISIFDELVGKTNLSAESKLARLIQSTSGEAKMAIKNSALVGGQVGYDQAIALLRKRFGNSNLIARSIIDNLISSKNVSPKDLAQLADNISIAIQD